jgi:hypothetical protein
MIKTRDRFKKIKIEIIAIAILSIILSIMAYFLFLGYGFGPIRCGQRGCVAGPLYTWFVLLSILLVGVMVSAFSKWRGY